MISSLNKRVCFVFPLYFRVLVVNLLYQVIVLSTISLFIGFHVDSSNGKIRSNRIIISNHICQYVTNLES